MKSKRIRIAEKIYRKKVITDIQEEINQLGSDTLYDAVNFLDFRFISSVLIFIASLLCFKPWYLYAPLITAFYYIILPKISIKRKVNQRCNKLEHDAMLFFEVLCLSLEAGKSLKSALEITAESLDSELSSEFKQTISEINYGKSLPEALNDLKKRIPSPIIDNIILNITECYSSGGNLIDSLRQQVDYIRDVKTMKTKEKINKMPIQISVISVLFFIPMILLLVLAPAIIEFLLK